MRFTNDHGGLHKSALIYGQTIGDSVYRHWENYPVRQFPTQEDYVMLRNKCKSKVLLIYISHKTLNIGIECGLQSLTSHQPWCEPSSWSDWNTGYLHPSMAHSNLFSPYICWYHFNTLVRWCGCNLLRHCPMSLPFQGSNTGPHLEDGNNDHSPTPAHYSMVNAKAEAVPLS